MESFRFISITWNGCTAVLLGCYQAISRSTSAFCWLSWIAFGLSSLSLCLFFLVCSMLLSSLYQVLSSTLFLSVKGGKSLPSAISCGYLCLLDWSHGFIYCFSFFSWHRRPSSSPTAADIHLLLPQPLAWCSFSCPISCDIHMGLCNVLFQYIHF